MSKTAIATALLAIGAALAAYRWIDRGDDPRPQPVSSPPSEPERAAGAGATAGERGAVDATPRSQAIEPSPAGPTTLTGTFVVADEQRVDHTDLDGQFTLLLLFGEQTQRVPVAVTSGRFLFTSARRPSGFFVADARLGDRVVACGDHGDLVDGATTLALRGCWLPGLNLRVVDRTTHADLPSVRIVRRVDQAPVTQHPGNRVREVTRGDSPLAFQPAGGNGSHVYWASSPGYAWSCIAIHADCSEQRELDLARGGDLEVVTTGAAPQRALIQVHRSVEAPAAAVDRAATAPVPQEIDWELSESHAEVELATGGTTPIEGLEPGAYVVRVAVTDGDHTSLTLGEAKAVVAVGGRATVAITLHSPAEPPRAPIAGSLAVGVGWPEPTAISLRAIGATRVWQRQVTVLPIARMQQLGEREWAWDAGELPAGSYEAAVVGIPHRVALTLPEEGNRNVQITVPEPADIAIHLIDVVDGAHLLEEHPVGWVIDATDPDGTAIPLGGRLQADGAYHVLALPGPVRVGATVRDYRNIAGSIVARPGANALTLHARREFGIDVVLLDGGTEVPWTGDIGADLVDDTGRSVLDGSQRNRFSPRVPGRFTLLVAEFGPYAAASTSVVVPDQGFQVHRLALRRRP